MENTPKIFAAMCNAMADIEAVGKNQINQQQKFKYRGIDDAMNALFPVMQKHRLFLTPEVLEHRREERQTKSGGNLIYSILKVRYTVYTDDGSSVSAIVIGEGMDSADKSSNKAIAAAMKYAIFQLFCIPTDDMTNDDPDKASPEASTPAQKEDKSKPFLCADCGKVITDYTRSNGVVVSASEMANRSLMAYKRCLCIKCAEVAKATTS